MRYIGSKTGVLGDISRMVQEKSCEGTFCDPFGGIGTVGSHFKSLGFRVYTGDLLDVAVSFQTAFISYSQLPTFKKLAAYLHCSSLDDIEEYLNNLSPRRSWLYREYAEKRMFFTLENAVRIEAIRMELSKWYKHAWINEAETRYLRACLIDAMDRVANTAGTYYAHLKHWDRKAKQEFVFRKLVPIPGEPGQVFHGDATRLIKKRSYNVIYLDPPYNDRHYGRYYHLPNAIASGRNPSPFGLSGVDQLAPRPSSFNSRVRACESARELIASARFDLLLFHYTNNGNIPIAELRSMLDGRGVVEEVEIDAVGYSSTGSRMSSHRLFAVTP